MLNARPTEISTDTDTHRHTDVQTQINRHRHRHRHKRTHIHSQTHTDSISHIVHVVNKLVGEHDALAQRPGAERAHNPATWVLAGLAGLTTQKTRSSRV